MAPSPTPVYLANLLAEADTLGNRLLLFLFIKEADTAANIADSLKIEKAEAMGGLGDLASQKLVGHRRPVDEPVIHWFATSEGKNRGRALHMACSASLLAKKVQRELEAEQARAAKEAGEAGSEAPVVEVKETPINVTGGTAEDVANELATGDLNLKSKRRVSIDQREKTGFSWN